MGQNKHLVTKKTKRIVRRMIAKGQSQKWIAQKLRISISSLERRYPKTIAKAVKLRKAATAPPYLSIAESSEKYAGIEFGRHGIVVPANCIISRAGLEKHATFIIGFDKNGMPLKRGGTLALGKKELAAEIGKSWYIGTPWQPIMEEWEAIKALRKSIAKNNWDCSLPDWEDFIKNEKPLIPDSIKKSLDRRMANLAVKAFKMLRLADVPDTPTLEESGAPWAFDLVEVIFGSYDQKTKVRMIKEIFLLVPKKNSKTTGGALIMLLLMIFNDRPRGQALMTAPQKDVAEIAFDAIAGAISLDKGLSNRFLVKGHVKTIFDRQNEAELSIIAYDPKALTGQKVFAALVDELHVIASMPKASNSLRQIRGGMLPFPEAVLIFITTQSEEAPSGVFLTELTNARNIRDGKRKKSQMLPVLYEFPLSMQQDVNKPWRDPKNWHIVTPNLGKSITLPALVANMEEAESKGEAEFRAWASQHLNIEIGTALRSDSWVGADLWDTAQIIQGLTLEHLIKVCEVIDIGIDGGGLDDLLGAAFTGRHAETGQWLTYTRGWAHKIVLDRNKQNAELLQDFQALGELGIVEKLSDAIDELVTLVQQVQKANLLDKIGLDPAGAGIIMSALIDADITADTMVGISQGWRLNGAIKTVESAIADGKIIHGNQKLLNWCVGNAKVEPRGNAILITKQASGTGKIDPLMAMFNSVHLISANPEAKKKKFQMFVLGGKATKAA